MSYRLVLNSYSENHCGIKAYVHLLDDCGTILQANGVKLESMHSRRIFIKGLAAFNLDAARVEAELLTFLSQIQGGRVLQEKPKADEGYLPGENSGANLPKIVVNDRHLRDVTTEALTALQKSNHPERIFRHGILSRISLDEYERPVIEPLNESSLRGCLTRSANFIRAIKEKEIKVPPPLDVTRDCLSLGDWDFPILSAITEVPVVRPDGGMLISPGYDATTKLLYWPSPNLSIPKIQDNPSKDDLKKAAELIIEAVCDFPFDSMESAANTIGTLITPVVRPCIEGPVPATVIDKPTQGTGASLIAETIALIATGRPAPIMTECERDEEWKKVITSLLVKGQLVAVLDNVDGLLYSPSLAALLTASTWQDRILGFSKVVTLPHLSTWIITGNNIKLAGDLPRRCIWVRLNAKTPRPWLRDKESFKHPNLLAWLTQHRGEILAAILTIVRAWVIDGKPEAPQVPRLGGYEGYCRVIGGLLTSMGITQFLGNLSDMYSMMDVETPQWENFLATWFEVIGSQPITAKELVDWLNKDANLRSSVPDKLADESEGFHARKIGSALSKKRDMQFTNGFVLSKAGELHRAIKWQVTKISEGQIKPQRLSQASFEEIPF